MRLESVPIKDIEIPTTRVTASYDEEQQTLLEDTIESMDILLPITLVEDSGKLILVDGRNRMREASRRGKSHIDAVIRPGNLKEALLENLVISRVKGKNRPSQLVEVIDHLMQNYGMDSDQIAESTGLKRDYIERIQKVLLASPSVREAVDQERIGVNKAYHLSRLPDFAQQDECIAKIGIFHLSDKDVGEMVDSVLDMMEGIRQNPPQQREIQEPIFSCEACQQRTDPRYLRPVNLCPNCFGNVYRLREDSAVDGRPHQEQNPESLIP